MIRHEEPGTNCDVVRGFEGDFAQGGVMGLGDVPGLGFVRGVSGRRAG
jgi:hypothetical protein